MFVVSFLVLMYLGLLPAEGLYVYLARIFTVLYFAYFAMLWVIPKSVSRPAKPRLKGWSSMRTKLALTIALLLVAGSAVAAEEGGTAKRPRATATTGRHGTPATK